MTKKKPNPASIPASAVTSACDSRNRAWWDSLTDAQREKFSTWLYMRYCASVESKVSEISEHYIRMVNDFVNVHFNDLRHHPQLQWYLMTLAGIGKKQYHPWVQPPKGIKKNKIQAWLSTVYPNLKRDEIEMVESMNTKQDFEDLAEQLGMSDKERKELFK